MELKHIILLIIGAIVAMFIISEKNMDYRSFVELVRKPKAKESVSKIKAPIKKIEVKGLFSIGNCIKIDNTDYYKIVAEEQNHYKHVLCKFAGKCLSHVDATLRTDFEISYNRDDIILCPLERE